MITLHNAICFISPFSVQRLFFLGLFTVKQRKSGKMISKANRAMFPFGKT